MTLLPFSLFSLLFSPLFSLSFPSFSHFFVEEGERGDFGEMHILQERLKASSHSQFVFLEKGNERRGRRGIIKKINK